MTESNQKRVVISAPGFGSIYSFELYTDKVITRLFGLFPIQTIHLSEIYYLRPATLDELARDASPLHCLNFLPQWHPILPMFVLQTKTRRFVMGLQKGSQYILNQAIEQSKVARRREMLASEVA